MATPDNASTAPTHSPSSARGKRACGPTAQFNAQCAGAHGAAGGHSARSGRLGFGQLLQGYTESSNVDAVSEISALIVAQRAYEMNSKVITTADDMLAVAAQVKS